jgi:hypothetical protein
MVKKRLGERKMEVWGLVKGGHIFLGDPIVCTVRSGEQDDVGYRPCSTMLFCCGCVFLKDEITLGGGGCGREKAHSRGSDS